MKAANLGLRFLLELSALAAVGYWGVETVDGVVGWALGLAGVAAVTAVWALFVSPKHTIGVSEPVSFGIELAVWLGAAAALYATDHTALALAFLVISVSSGVLNYAWR